MSNFTHSDINFAKLILQGNRDRVQQWVEDKSDPGLSDACALLIQAAAEDTNHVSDFETCLICGCVCRGGILCSECEEKEQAAEAKK